MFASIFSILADAAADPAAAAAAVRGALTATSAATIAAEINAEVARQLMHALSSFVYDSAVVQPDALRVAAEVLARIAQSGEVEPLALLMDAELENFTVKVRRPARARARAAQAAAPFLRHAFFLLSDTRLILHGGARAAATGAQGHRRALHVSVAQPERRLCARDHHL
jgi:hypothetical protein